MIKGIIFDMDGVIIDSNHIHYENWSILFKKKFKVDIEKEDFSNQLGRSGKHFTEYFLKKFGIGIDAETLKPEIRNRFLELRDKIQLKKGIAEALRELKPKYKIALATGADKEWAVELVTKFGIYDCFDYIIAGNEVKVAKPEPEIFLKAAEMLKLRPEECVVVEDAALGLIAAKKAGMTAISIPDDLTRHQDHSMADLHLTSISELTSEKLGVL